MNKTKKVAWHKHLKSRKKYEKKLKATRTATAGAATTPAPRAGAKR
ncbi:MAG TPA: hypothetical protein VF739_02205 [Ktedonobacterales bacterium]